MAKYENRLDESDPKNPHQKTRNNTINQKHLIIVAIYLLFFTALMAYLFAVTYPKFEKYRVIQKVAWKCDSTFKIDNSPPWFLYDSDTLQTLKQITAEDKLVLMNLVSRDVSNYDGYVKAVNKLAFISNANARVPFLLILLLAGISAIMGVIIRTAFDFIGRVCYKRDFDFSVWWPWYFVRPILGFLIGCIVIVFLEAGLIENIKNYDDSSAVLLGVTALAGFAVQDVVSLLRNISKKLFFKDDPPQRPH